MKNFNIESPAINNRIIIKNDLAFSFVSRMPIVPGHLLICPIRVVEFCEDLNIEEWQAILTIKKQVCQALKTALKARGFSFSGNDV